ncbi:MAG: DUF559 domain-containing protein [Anaerolineae bacterium]|nr:DUF559 domain-containing protein [Anaerolineae bacterium]
MRKKDMVRQEYLEGLGLRVIRFTNEEVMKSLEGVLRRIDEALTTPPPAPPHA